MTSLIDETHDAARRSWVASANGHPQFPIQNLPFGVFSVKGDAPRGGVAIGDEILDLKAALEAGIFSGLVREAAAAAAGPTLNGLHATRHGATRRPCASGCRMFLAGSSGEAGRNARLASKLLHRASDCTLHLPAAVGAYTDFFAGIHHAHNAGVRGGTPAPAHAQLQVRSGGLSQPGLFGGRVRRRDRGARTARERRPAIMNPASARAASSISSSNWACGSGPETRWASLFRSPRRATTSSASAC